MSQPIVVPPVHETSPPPFVDDVDENDINNPTMQNDEFASSASSDALNNSNDDWKSVDDHNEYDVSQVQDDKITSNSETVSTDVNVKDEGILQPENQNHNDDDGWANFATFENTTDEFIESPSQSVDPTTTSANNEDDWANFESNPAPIAESDIQLTNNDSTTNVIDNDDDDFGAFSEVQAIPEPQIPSSSTHSLSSEQIGSLLSTCFPIENVESMINDDSSKAIELPSFTTYKSPSKRVPYLESSLSLWDVLSNIANDPIGIRFQWRKSNTERLFHQALGVNERFRTKNSSLTPEILQPEKAKQAISKTNTTDALDTESKLPTENVRPHFDWKQSGLENPLADTDSSSRASNLTKNDNAVFDANKTLDLDFYVPQLKTTNEDEKAAPQKIDSPIVQHQSTSSVTIKTMDLFPGSTTTISDDAKRIIDTFPNLSFMSAKALMFPIRFNANNTDDTTPLY